MDASGDDTPIDLLEHIHATLGDFDDVLLDRSVSIEMLRLRAQVDPVLFRRALGLLIADFLARSDPSDGVTVRVGRSDDAIRLEVLNDDGYRTSSDPPDLASVSAELEAAGAAIGVGPPDSPMVGWITIPMPGDGSGPPDA